jgi:hypothetical protein
VRVLLRVLAPLLGLAVAVVGVLVLLEVVAAWVRPDHGDGLVVPWPEWYAALEQTAWTDAPVPGIAIGTAVLGLLLVLVGLLARRHDIAVDGPASEITVTTSPAHPSRRHGTGCRWPPRRGATPAPSSPRACAPAWRACSTRCRCTAAPGSA